MAIVILNTVGQCGPLLGTNIFPTTNSPRYVKGQTVCAAFMFFNAFLALSLRLLLSWENKKLDQKYGKLDHSKKLAKTEVDQDSAQVGEENYGKPSYTYQFFEFNYDRLIRGDNADFWGPAPLSRTYLQICIIRLDM